MSNKTRQLTILVVFLFLLMAVGSASAFHQTQEDLVVDGVFEEKFGDGFWDRGWDRRVLIGNPDGNYFNLGKKRMSFMLPPTSTLAILTNSAVNFADVKVEGTFENVRSAQASYSILCRYSEDGWYELLVFVAGPEAGAFKLQKYDPYLREQFKNPFVVLHQGMERIFTGDIKLGMNQKNKIGLLCDGEEFKVFINDREQVMSKSGKILDDQFEEGAVGVSVQSYGQGLVDVDVTKFSASEP